MWTSRRVTLVAAAATVVTLGVVVASIVRTVAGTGPEGAVAEAFLADMLAGDGQAAHAHTSAFYRAVVLPDELDLLADALVGLGGTTDEVELVGTRTTSPTTTVAGYTARTAIGVLEGVVTLVREDGAWAVQDASWYFVDGPPTGFAELNEVVARLNAQVAERLAG